MLNVEFPIEKQGIDDLPSLNHSYICSQILRQLFAQESIEVLTELTLDIDKGLTPDICVFLPNPLRPIFPEMLRK